MPRLMGASLMDALNRPNARFETHSTLQLLLLIGTELRSYYFSTATLNFNGIVWQPQLRKSAEIISDLSSEGDEASLELENVDTILGVNFIKLQQYLFGATAIMGRYWKSLDYGSQGHEVLLTGLVIGLDPNETILKLTVVSDTYSGVSVGPIRNIRRLCPFLYKGFECGRPLTDPPTCDFTLNGAGGCDGRWGSTQKFARFGGAAYLDNLLQLKII